MENKEAKKYRNYIIFGVVALIASIVCVVYFHERSVEKYYAFLLFAAIDLMELVRDIFRYRDAK